MSKILDYLLRKDVKVVFDVDGVLCPYEFGNLSHQACPDAEWETFMRKHKPYDKFRAIPQMRQFIHDKGVENVYTCSVSEPYEEENKRNFIIREYGLPEEHIIFVRNKAEKVYFLYELNKEIKDQRKIALVEDTVETLDRISGETGFTTVHISSFFYY